jgi:hypothetical protein
MPDSTRTIVIPADMAPFIERLIAQRDEALARGQSLETPAVAPAGSVKRPLTSIPLTLGLCSIAFMWTVALNWLTETYFPLFRDFHTNLPAVTRWMFALDHGIRAGGWIAVWAAALGLPILIMRLLPARAYYRRPETTLIIASSTLALVTLSMLILGFAYMAPFTELVNTVSASTGAGV